MSKFQKRILLLLSDFIAINVASVFFLWMKFAGNQLENIELGWRRLQSSVAGTPPFWFALNHYLYDALPAICVCWLLFFLFNGMYRGQPTLSRFDEVVSVFKVVTVGTLLWFIATFNPEQPFPLTRAVIFSYWFALIGLVAGGRVIIHSFQRQLLVRGIGWRNTVIVGTDERGERLSHDLKLSPAQGYNVIGFVRTQAEEEKVEIGGIRVLGSVVELRKIISENEVEVVLIALKFNSHEEILEIVDATGGESVSFGITPDLYDIVTGHVRTNQIYGVPLMELKPELMPTWEQAIKRLIDTTVAVVVGLGLAPLWILVALAIKIDSKGPVFFRQERVGREGKVFIMYKFRSMVPDAEESTGPVWVKGEDPRVTRMGRILRALHLDEIPQCINFFKGNMSLVGPRPERPYFVEKFRKNIPLYMRRFNVKPGLLGWAQSKHEFDINSSDVEDIARERLEHDLYYIENISLKLDLKIMLRTVWFVMAGKSTR